eukprot:6467101-Amphidinium_carterae.2
MSATVATRSVVLCVVSNGFGGHGFGVPQGVKVFDQDLRSQGATLQHPTFVLLSFFCLEVHRSLWPNTLFRLQCSPRHVEAPVSHPLIQSCVARSRQNLAQDATKPGSVPLCGASCSV